MIEWSSRSSLPAGTVAGHIFDQNIHHVFIADDLPAIEVLRCLGHESLHCRGAEGLQPVDEKITEREGRRLASWHPGAVVHP